MSNTPKIVATSDVGRPKWLSETHTIVATFHDFENVPHKPKQATNSPAMACHGHSWKISLYSGGNEESSDPFTSVYLDHKSDVDAKVTFSLQLGAKKKSGAQLFQSGAQMYGWHKFACRRDILDPNLGYLEDDGSVRVRADIQVWRDIPPVWFPRKSLHRDMLDSLETGTEGDTFFTVNGKKFVVFQSLIARRAPVLGELAASGTAGTPISIHDVDPDAFAALLHFVYSDEIPENVGFRELLEVADRFGCSRLKLTAEAEIVKDGIDATNAVELLLFADAHSCALLREAALEFCVTHPDAIKKSEGWKQLKESAELLAEFVGPSTLFLESDYDTMRVATLRQKLEDKGLEVDGTRETLIGRLKDATSDES